MVSAPPPIAIGEGDENLPRSCGDKIFSHICGGIDLYGWSSKQMGV